MDEKTLNTLSSDSNTLYMAFDLGAQEWKVAATDRSARRPIETSVAAFEWETLDEWVQRVRAKLGLDAGPVLICYEAGRDAFSVARAVALANAHCLVVDPASIETSSRRRNPKTDRIDARKLLAKLRSFVAGDRDVFSVVRVPSEDIEDARRPSRERERLVSEASQHSTRIGSLLAAQGVRIPLTGRFVAQLKACRTAAGQPLKPHLKAEILREFERLELVNHQIAEIEAQIEAALANPKTEAEVQGAKLNQLLGVGLVTAATVPTEVLWRDFRNRKEVGAAAGLVGTPHQTGHSTDRELGITKSGNKRVRTLMIQIAWTWVRLQPTSELTQWYRGRLDGTKRTKRKVIVAVARRLLISLWRYATQDILPKGAILRAT